MAYVFDTDALSEVFRPKPAPVYLEWLQTVPRDQQLTTSISIAEMYAGAFRSQARARHLANIETHVLPLVRVLPFDARAARRFGEIQAFLESRGTPLDDMDLQIAAITLAEGHELVTGNLRHFERVPGLRINTALAAARPPT